MLGIATVIAGEIVKAAELSDIGKTLIGVGLGYFTHAALSTTTEASVQIEEKKQP